ncbi:CRISPR-associated protein Cas4 [Chlorobaculum sp. MV4-Y]|uniref:CRISPR-associated protein Cas4 n=1 Tax=Chlorobaculum sp. MV4-Y TaxID=2976335 RepID=UPI0021B04E7D|nr:CRISPR-associated protein Cas4 [Chlorobaculum sp. MV4-Y]UWX58577.1 CRISPR-associated protein Cas4 [Chlorobaculum sp. MV4-Y]
MYPESDFIALSALQHYVFCPRQCALIHLEQVWSENQFTAEGREMHERADSGVSSYREGVKVTRSVALRSLALGVSGVADVVEWHRRQDGFEPFPVEYKRGKPKKHDADKVQLCAQAMCLEEMRSCTILTGALFYGQTMHRLDVVFDEPLRAKTVAAAAGVHELFASGVMPQPEFGPKCKQCSLVDECMPEVLERQGAAKRYVEKLYRELSEEEI